MTDENGVVRKGKDNVNSFYNPLTKNTITILAPPMNYQMALLSGRGMTTSTQYIDEFDFINFIRTIMNTAAPAFRTAAANAEMNNAPYGRILTSTPGDISTPAGLESYEMIMEMPMWKESLYDYSKEEIVKYVNEHGTQPFLRIEYMYSQLGKTKEWFDEVTKGLDRNTIRRDYLIQRVLNNPNTPFDMDDLDYINNNISEPICEIEINGQILEIYEHLDKKARYDVTLPYLIGVDCSTGTGHDYQAITIINPFNLKVAAEFKSQWLGEFDLCTLLHDLVKKYFHNAVLCIERNSVGSVIIDNLQHTDVSHRLYHDIGQDMLAASIHHQSDPVSILKKNAEMKRMLGVYTSSASRVRMMDIIQKHVHELKDLINTKNLVADIAKLIMKPSGRIEAEIGFHDDCVMSYLIAMYVWYHGNNLRKFGIDKNKAVIYQENEGLLKDYTSEIQSQISKEINRVYSHDIEEEIDEDKEFLENLNRVRQQSAATDKLLAQKKLITSDETNQIPYTNEYEEENESAQSVFTSIRTMYQEDNEFLK
jgi:hypothetical protein